MIPRVAWLRILLLFPLVYCLALSSCASAPTVLAACAQNKDYKKEFEGCTTDIRSNPTNDLARLYLSAVLLHYGKYQDALQNIDIAIDSNKSNAWYYVMRCHVNEALKQYPDALKDCSTAVNIVENDQKYRIYLDLGAINYDLGNYANAITNMNAAINANPKDTLAYGWRCKLLFLTSDYSNAVTSCENYIKNAANQDDDTYFAVMAYAGAAYYQLKQFDLARPYAAWILQNDPLKTIHFSGDQDLQMFNLDARREKVKSLVAQAQLQESLGNQAKTFDLYYDAYTYRSALTPGDQKLGDDVYSTLLKLYSQLHAKPVQPELENQYQVEGDTFIKNNDSSDAIKSYKTAFSIAPWYPPLSYNLALLYAQQKDYGNAAQYMNQYIKLVPDAPDAKEAQNKIYEWTAEAGLPN